MNKQHYIKTVYKDLLALAVKAGQSVYQNEFNKLSNLKSVRETKDHHLTIQNIFRTHWKAFKAKYEDKLRDSIIDNVERMIDCRDLSKGHLFFECPTCDFYHLVGLSCHSRFCASCGHKYRDQRSIEIQKKLLKVPHRHFVFSIPYDLRPYFWKCRELFDCLFKTVNEALHFSIQQSKEDASKDYRLGFVSFLHTSGRALNPHPHIHVLLAEAMIDRDGHLKNTYFFPFERLRKAFMFMFLRNASKILKVSASKDLYREFNILRTQIIKQYKDGFYTYGPKVKEYSKFYNVKKIADYIARYASHPPIAESNIISLEENGVHVTWRYTPHEDKENPVTVHEHAFDFIGKLIRHIHDKGFHQLRYYGFYANKSNRIKDKPKLVSSASIDCLKSKLKWRIMLLKTFKYDPVLCTCGTKMVLNLELSYLTYKKEYISDA
jgi:transposase-like protein